MTSSLDIEIVYCLPEKQLIERIQVSEGCTAGEAVAQSKLLADTDILREQPLRIGIFGKTCSTDTLLKAHDRVEIYRPLLLSPTEARRLRAKNLSKK